MPLRTWQQPYADRQAAILAEHNCLNCSDTGVGKTFLAADTIGRLQRKTLVWAPKSVLTAWRKVAYEMGVADLLLDCINPEQLIRGNTAHFKENKWLLPPDAMLIVDELHQGCSGANSQQTQVLALTKAWNIRVLMQSATPATSPLQMRASGYLLGLHGYTSSSFYGWCRRNGCFQPPYCNGLAFPKGPKGAAIMRGIHEKIQDRIVRIRIKDVPGFPTCEIQPRLYDLKKDYLADVNKIYAEMEARIKEPGANEMVELLRARQRTERYKVPLLRDLTLQRLDDGLSVVVFTCFRETLDSLAKDLTANDIPTVRIWGEQTREERDIAIQEFQANKARCLLATQQAGGVGISLHDLAGDSPRTALMTPGFRAADMVQTFGRIWRDGGTPVVQQIVLVAGSVEERVYRSFQAKLNCIDSLRDGDLK
jgi:hypothetical protein